MEFLSYLIEKAYILIPVLLIIGSVLKATPKLPNWLIPYMLLACGVSGAVSIIGFTPEGIFQGVIAAGVAVYGYEAFKALREGMGVKK